MYPPMYPSTIQDVIRAIDAGTIVKDEHIDYCGVIRDYNSIVRRMVSVANSGGGLVIIGYSIIRGYRIIADLVKGSPVEYFENLDDNIRKAINGKVRNLEEGINWRIEKDLQRYVAALFVMPSTKGMTYLYAESDPTNRSYVYRVKDEMVTHRFQYKTLYKYMSLDAFITCLESGKWRFYEPDHWDDKFESRFYRAEYKIPGSACVRRVFATCLTQSKKNEAAWKVYAGNEGLKAHCVQIELDVNKLLEQFFQSDRMVFERRVQYMDEYLLMNLHKPASPIHADFFDAFCFNKYLNLLALKRDSYKYENEVRFFALPADGSVPADDHIDLKINWADVIKYIRISKRCSDSELVALRYSCASSGIDLQIKHKVLACKAVTTPGSKVVEAELFNIDEMPGSAKIVIQ